MKMMLNEKPEISIIIPVYNAEKYLENCLESIARQTFINFELLIFNDCSTDNSDNIIKKFITNNPDIKYQYSIFENNIGDCSARNIGIKNACGSYICFLDADDKYAPDYLALLYEEINITNSDFAFCGFDVNNIVNNKYKKYTDTKIYPQNRSKNSLIFNYMIGKLHICHCAVLINHDFLIRNHIIYTEKCYCAGDTEFIMKILFCCKKFSYVNRSLYFYTIRPNSITTSFPNHFDFDIYYTYKRIGKFIKNPLWRLCFIFTKKSRGIYTLMEKFYDYKTELPYLFCSKYRILFHLLIYKLINKEKKSRYILIWFYNNYIRKV